MSEWQPIETAPRDGTQILAWNGAVFICAEFVTFADGTAHWHQWIRGSRASVGASVRLTHWMPLPEPPKP